MNTDYYPELDSSRQKMTKILIADDQPQVCSALRLLLEQQPFINVVGEISNNDELINWLLKNEADMVLLDWEIPGIPSQDIIPVLRSTFPKLATVVLDSKPQTEKQAFKVGAAGFIGKNEPPDRLLATIISLSAGGKGEQSK
jgi:DNA-binding NarL/FixJ family response regulator